MSACAQILIGYETGFVALWDLKLRSAAARFLCQQPLRSLSWFSDSKSFVVGHLDGALSTWQIKQPLKPVALVYPHGTRVPALHSYFPPPFLPLPRARHLARYPIHSILFRPDPFD